MGSETTAKIRIRRITADDKETFLDAVDRSRDLFGDWVSPPDNPETFARHLRKYSTENNRSFLALTDDGELVGCINLGEIVRGAFQSAYLGYYAFAPHHGKGLMKRALGEVVELAFGDLGLHRLEANIQPGNAASIGLVESLGFRREGYSPRYLRIGGAWRDHERYAITVEDWAETKPPPR